LGAKGGGRGKIWEMTAVESVESLAQQEDRLAILKAQKEGRGEKRFSGG